MRTTYPILFFLSLVSLLVTAQNQNSKWYFGVNAALDFMQIPPANIPNSAMVANRNCASQADDNGVLLFYTDGLTVYNSTNAIMANGTGLLGNFTPYQPCVIIRKPGSSTLHYIFTVQGNGQPGGLTYSVVDMSLAAGQGSVIIKNAPIYSAPCVESVTGTWHCNGQDYWVITRENNLGNHFRAYLLSSSGISTSPVISSIGPLNANYNVTMRVSPNGSRLAAITSSVPTHCLSLFDFDNSSGTLSNYLQISNSLNNPNYGLEFSPDGSKLYCGAFFSSAIPHNFRQWDLCAGSATAISASEFTLSCPDLAALQLAPDGKIYVAVPGPGAASLGVVNSPNMSGAACNFVLNGQNLGGKISTNGLPNLITRYKAPLTPFTHTLNTLLGCHAMSFTANLPPSNCTLSNFSVTNISWDFGDPSTGALNVSSSQNPVHVYSSSGTFTTSLIFYYKCSSDTIRQIIQIPPPNIAVTWSPNCDGMASGTVAVIGGVGPYTYSWPPSAQTGSVVSNLNAGTYSVTLTDHGLACKVKSVIIISVNPVASFSLNPSGNASVCVGSNTLVQIIGNCNGYTLTPTLGTSISNTNIVFNPPTSQTYTLTGSLNACTVSATYNLMVLALPSASIMMEKSKACLNTNLKLFGSGGLTYAWEGPAGFSSQEQNISRFLNKINDFGTYTLQVTDLNGCKNSTTKVVESAGSPTGTLTGFKTEICIPNWSDFVFMPEQNASPVLSSWEINRETFTDTFRYQFKVPGTYTIQGILTDTSTFCTSKLSYLVQAHSKPKAQYYYKPERIVENTGEEVVFINSSSGDEQMQWSWYFYASNKKTALPFANGESVSRYFPEMGTYIVALVVADKWGCADTVIKNLLVEEDYHVWVPNTFTPNDDSRNDQFLVVGSGLKVFYIQIFNRWGKLIFQNNDVSQGWDGTYHGQPVENGVYTWVINTTSNAGEQKQQTGHVLLAR